jgi:hypothetical protein
MVGCDQQITEDEYGTIELPWGLRVAPIYQQEIVAIIVPRL